MKPIDLDDENDGLSGESSQTQMRTMVLEYLPTKLCHFWGFYVGKYSSTMEHLGMTENW